MRKRRKNLKHLVFVSIAILVLTGLASEARANLVDSNSIIKDDIEYYFQTDKSVYDLGENVDMLYRVKNIGDESVMFRFRYHPVTDRCNFMVDKDGDRIWDNLNRPKCPAETSFTLSLGESKSFNWSWDMTDLSNNQILPGIYDVTGILGDLSLGYEDKYVPVSVEIQLVPEPATICLLGTGIIGILSYRKRKK